MSELKKEGNSMNEEKESTMMDLILKIRTSLVEITVQKIEIAEMLLKAEGDESQMRKDVKRALEILSQAKTTAALGVLTYDHKIKKMTSSLKNDAQ